MLHALLIPAHQYHCLLYLHISPFACGQLGCTWMFTQTSDCTKHIQNHHLSWLNIQLNIHVLPQSLSPPTTHWSSTRSRSPPQAQDVCQQAVSEQQMPELINNDDDNEEDYNMNPPGEHPSTDHPFSHSPPPPQSFGNGAPKVPSTISCIFHPTINGTS